MRTRRLFWVLAFDSTAQAMAAEALFTARALPGRMVPVPEEITAGCGMAWRAGPGDREALLAALRGAGLGSGPEGMVEMYG